MFHDKSFDNLRHDFFRRNFFFLRLKKNPALLLVLSLLASLSLAGCGAQAVSSGGTGSTEIKVGQAGPQTVEGTLTLSGVFASESSAVITSQLAGKVQAVNMQEGSRVKKGDVLITLDQSDLQSQLQQAELGLQKAQSAVDQAKISYDNAQATFLRNQQLFAANAISQAQMDQVTVARDLAKSQYDAAANVGLPAAQAAVDAVKLNLAKTTIVSPLDGVVATSNVSVGDNVMPGTPLATIVSSGDPVLTANVSETALSKLSIGQKVDVKADTVPGAKFTGVISFISPVSVPTGQFFPVKVTVQDPNSRLKPGMTGSATINVSVKAAVTLPNSALFRRDGRTYVYLVKDGKAVKSSVQLGFQGDKYSEVTQGITAGDSVVIQGTDQLVDGMKIPE